MREGTCVNIRLVSQSDYYILHLIKTATENVSPYVWQANKR